MNTSAAQWVWLNEHDVCSATNLVEVSGLSNEEFDELVAVGVIAPVDNTVQIRSFYLRNIATVKTARRLRDDFELDLHGIALAMTLVRRIDELHEELLAARAQLG